MWLTAGAIALPVLVIAGSLLGGFSPVWQHLLATVLPDYVRNSLLLMLGVGVGTLVLGVGGAWLTAMCEFPGRRWFNWGRCANSLAGVTATTTSRRYAHSAGQSACSRWCCIRTCIC